MARRAKQDPFSGLIVLLLLMPIWLPMTPIWLPILLARYVFLSTKAKMHQADLEKIIMENPHDVERRKADIAIQMNVNAVAFEEAWNQVVTKHPHLFPSATAEREILAFCEAISTLLATPKRLVTKEQVARLSGLSRDRVEELWPQMHKHGYFFGGFIEDEPPRPIRR
ncbi:hypothetical protein [Aeromonas caviae]|uniref:hypothetical protein n=1 Tax=Aeromonas caviae TaxID=648 RepID=UPI003F745549